MDLRQSYAMHASRNDYEAKWEQKGEELKNENTTKNLHTTGICQGALKHYYYFVTLLHTF